MTAAPPCKGQARDRMRRPHFATQETRSSRIVQFWRSWFLFRLWTLYPDPRSRRCSAGRPATHPAPRVSESQAAGCCRENVKRCRLSRTDHAVMRTQPSQPSRGCRRVGWWLFLQRIEISGFSCAYSCPSGHDTRALVSGTMSPVWP